MVCLTVFLRALELPLLLLAPLVRLDPEQTGDLSDPLEQLQE
jgi:hypothetical protein